FGLQKTPANGEAGIVDQNIEAAEVVDDAIDHRLDPGKVGDVGLVGFRLAAGAGDLSDQRFGFLRGGPIVDRDACAFGGEAQRDFAADAARGTAHERDLSFQAQVHGLYFPTLEQDLITLAGFRSFSRKRVSRAGRNSWVPSRGRAE